MLFYSPILLIVGFVCFTNGLKQYKYESTEIHPGRIFRTLARVQYDYWIWRNVPDHPGQCWWAPTQTAYAVNGQFTDQNTCELLKCEPNSQFVRIGFVINLIQLAWKADSLLAFFVCFSCDVRRGEVQAGCSRSGNDLTKAYPECCSKVVCAPVKIEYWFLLSQFRSPRDTAMEWIVFGFHFTIKFQTLK